MDNPDRTAKPHVLFSGSLSDAPGRDEHWNEHVTYLGREKWQLTIEGSTFDGGAEAAPEQSTMTTEELLQWALEQADENDEGGGNAHEDDERPPLSRRLQRLMAIANAEGAKRCVRLIDRVRRGSWPSAPKSKPVLVTDVVRIERRVIMGRPWVRDFYYEVVFLVETNGGRRHMSRPIESGWAALRDPLRKGEEVRVRLSPPMMERVAGLLPQFDALAAIEKARWDSR